MYRPAYSGSSKMVMLSSCSLVPVRTTVVSNSMSSSLQSVSVAVMSWDIVLSPGVRGRAGLWAFVVRTLQGQETGRGRNYPTAAAAMQAAEASTAPAKPNREIATQVTDYLRTKQGGTQ